MPRPDYITHVHEALYDLRTSDLENRVKMLRRYQDTLSEAARLSQCSEAALEEALRNDYKVWLRQERLPRID